MRCHRCHSKIDPGRKMCPVCGTLVRKPRGSLNVSRQAGGSLFGNMTYSLGRFFDKFNLKIILAAVCGVILVIVISMTFRCGPHDMSGGFESCGTPSSCAVLGSMSDSCGPYISSCSSFADSCGDRLSCTSSPSDISGNVQADKATPDNSGKLDISSVQVKPQSGSCAGKINDDISEYENSLNSTLNGREYLYKGNLYYSNNSGVYYTNDRDETRFVIHGNGINAMCIENDRLYYIMAGDLWTAPLDSSSSAVCLFDTAEEGASLNRIHGFGISDSFLCCWGTQDGDGFAIVSISLDTGEERTLYSGRCAQQQVYRGSVYFLSREDKDLNTMYRISLNGGYMQELLKLPVSYYALCGGDIFAYTWIDNEAELYKISCDTLEITSRWDFRPIRGMMANDSRVYYYCNDADGTGSVYSIMPDGSGNRMIFSDKSIIQLNHIAGNCISLYTDINGSTENKYTGASYYIINIETGDKRMVE